MKRIIFTTLAAALAFSTLGTTAAVAQQYPGPGYNHAPGYGQPQNRPGPNHSWRRGGHYQGPRYVVRGDDYNRYHLRQPPRGYEWVQDGGQFVMIAVASGVIADILLNH